MENPAHPARLLLCEDDLGMLALVERVMSGMGHSIKSVQSARDLLAAVRESQPDLILLDIKLDGANGFELVREILRDPAMAWVPIIFLTALRSKDDVVRGLNIGAVDYIVKPFEARELSARIATALRMKFEIDKLRQVNSELQEMALLDPLTGLYNRRFVMARLAQAVAEARRYGEPLSCLMMDMDGFKRVNDQYGHLQGDLVLRSFARLLNDQVRSSDTAGRYGGEEFVVVGPQTAATQAGTLAERIRVAVAAHDFPGPDSAPLHLTISIGIAAFDPKNDSDGESLLARADAAMYRAKQAGGNSFCTAD